MKHEFGIVDVLIKRLVLDLFSIHTKDPLTTRSEYIAKCRTLIVKKEALTCIVWG